MTVENGATTSPAGSNGTPQRCRGRGRALVFLLILALGAGLTGALATKALSQGYGMGFGPAHWHGGLMGGPLDAGQIAERADRGVRHLAIEIDATPEQQDKLRAMVRSAVGDLVPMRDKLHGARQQARDLLTQPTVDRGEIEKLRAQQIALADAASKRIAQAL